MLRTDLNKHLSCAVPVCRGFINVFVYIKVFVNQGPGVQLNDINPEHKSQVCQSNGDLLQPSGSVRALHC